MGFFDLKVQCSVCDKEVGLNRYQLQKNVWICPTCKKAILKKYRLMYTFSDLQKMSIEELKELAGFKKKYSDEDIKSILDFCSESQSEFLQQFDDE